jgi:GNAT superfamily N-acetyltransferase
VQIELIPVRTTDDTPERWFAVLAPTYAKDYPTLHPWPRELAVGGIRYPKPGEEAHWWLAGIDGVDVGGLCVTLPLMDNTETALLEVFVALDYRHRGIGSQLMEHGLEFASNAGRPRQMAQTTQEIDAQPPPAMGFLERRGFKPALHELFSHLDLTTLDETTLSTLAAEAQHRSSGYVLETWVGPPPDDEACAQLGFLEGTLSEDAPLGDLEWERENWDAARVRQAHENLQRTGAVSLHAVARDRTGRIVAWTHLVSCPSEPTWAMQWNTVVDPAHRGHRLGVAVKTANLVRLRALLPAVERIETGNAEENEHMLRVNRAMGFVPVAHSWEYQRTGGFAPRVPPSGP